MKYEILTAKTGRKYLKVTISEFEAFIFPSKAEIAYLEGITRAKAHKEFEEDDDSDNGLF